MVLVIDNYDSFTYNIVQYLGSLGEQLTIWRNDTFKLSDVNDLDPKAIILSPGPGHPKDAGLTCKVIETFKGKIPIMGVCLGHQAIGLVEGGTVNEADKQLHGKMSCINLADQDLFKDLPEALEVVRYHSLVIDKATCPNDLEVISTDSVGEIMAVKHKAYPMYGVQFHPESYSTQGGMKILQNFIGIANDFQKEE